MKIIHHDDYRPIKITNVFIDKNGNAIITFGTEEELLLGTLEFNSIEVAMIIGAHDIKLSEK